ncbi:zinc finger protein 510 [Condylostylus longicornis]|uniref:zinc finger protein 510 n=1 Tax=Condylostylus longicornis TaxID=2530218 RepID=UPI00244DCDD7|nr:zinc finger protein 510 [Condylostylus longicornis]
MSKIDMSPPQTYSRLFRPWDNTKLTNRKDTGEIFVQNEYELNNTTALAAITAPFALQNALIDPLGLSSTAIAVTASEYYFESSIINNNELQQQSVSTIIDPLAISFMEHEYARVMAEDAHLKALNARKQRPKKFKCPHCNVAFSNNGQLKGHIRIHTGERPFKCDLETCGKTFTRNEELTRHKRIHTGLRPYGCSNCGKKFGRRDHLKKHMKTHMPQERHLGHAIYVPMYPYLYGY